MEATINVLSSIQNTIHKGFVNFKKSPKDRLTLEYLESRKELLEQQWNKFDKLYSKIYEDHSLKEVEKSVGDIYDNTEDNYITYKTLLKTMLNKLPHNIAAGQNEPDNNSNKKSSGSLVKLPKITIPTFSGKYSEWTTFNDLFTALVHRNESLNDCQKLHYLKNHLTGEAEQLIRHTPISDANYAQCWAILANRYNNKRYQADCILKRLFSQRRIYAESGSALKELLDTTNDCLNALKNINVDVTTWDIIIIHIVAYKLDLETRKQWELSISPSDSNQLPTLQQFQSFLETRFRALEFIEPKKSSVHQITSSKFHTNSSTKAMLVTNSSARPCEYCSEVHKLCFCKQFANESIETRRDFVAKNKICFNCLGSNHTKYSCKNPSTCKICKRRHHSLLHMDEAANNNSSESSSILDQVQSSLTEKSDNQVVSCLSTNTVPKLRQVLLATALINAKTNMGNYQVVRALLDQGSQACFVTEATVQLLNLKKMPVQGIISGLGNDRSTIAKYVVDLSIQSRVDDSFKVKCRAYVLKRITSYMPDQHINLENLDWIASNGLHLADPNFNVPNRVDVLLGADVYSKIIKEGIIKNHTSTLMAQNTSLGWILSGTVHHENKEEAKKISVLHTNIKEDDILRRFWEIEELSTNKKIFTQEEEKCEELYQQTTKRDRDGRYIVKLPFRVADPPCKAGNSRGIAEARFKALEKRFRKNTVLKEEYTKVINEYLELGHMRAVKEKDDKRQEAVYLPHHAVIRNDKTTTKVRVVFNASEKNNKGVSLNDTLMVGPALQADLRHTVLKWRRHSIGLVADVVKMYRQVRIAEEDTMYQRILWRDTPETPIKDYELLTITFGTASAPYQAVKTLHQIAFDEGEQYPIAKTEVLNSFYMDDLMTGCDTVEAGSEIYKQIVQLLRKGGFTLQKWNSNDKQMLKVISAMEDDNIRDQASAKMTYIGQDNKEHNSTEIQEQKKLDSKLDSTIKILGLTWNRSEDIFQYSVKLSEQSHPLTKRAVISDIARLFDPLGWLAPCVVLSKVFIQKLWLTGIGWDETLPANLIKEWNTYRTELELVSKVRIPRWLGTKPGDEIELHGFCDASKVAYAAVVYLRRRDITNQIHVSLLLAKTRVAPVKQVSVPRLELCGAVLLAKLLRETSEVLSIPIQNIRAWTDSTVVLAWINSHPSRWKTFVANRTSEILNIMNAAQWFHVSTSNNPADCASRGLLPSSFIEHEIWFTGPKFLKKEIIYSKPKKFVVDLEESIKTYVALVPAGSILERFSSLSRLFRVIAYCRRFLSKGRNKKGHLQSIEIEEAKNTCIKLVQKDIFAKEYNQLKDKGFLQGSSSCLTSLCPYLDHKGIMRVRGRLEKSQLDEHTKHPIILPKSHLTDLIIADAHNKTMHGGPQLMLNYIRTAYWIVGVRNLVKYHVRRCVICTRQRVDTKNQFMGSLPSVRCTPARPFLHSGVDYAGPINIRTTKGRGYKSYKGYICLFVCMSTRAIHLEVVSDMSTPAFLAAFRRFVSTRGHCAKLWSDNATTFVGADRELQQLTTFQSTIAEHLEAVSTEWHFIPPRAPNFGGLWEAGVKSTKFHLKRVIGESTLTYEEMSTLLKQIEACLNSRPISVISTNDPSDPVPLTPGHFLIGEPLIGVPDYNHTSTNVSCLTRWKLIQRMLQGFWKRWSSEYLTTLINRYKWAVQVPEPKVGDIVLIKEDDLPPCRWLLGRIEQKHPGDDNITRVVTVRTKLNILKRPTSKLCILPIVNA